MSETQQQTQSWWWGGLEVGAPGQEWDCSPHFAPTSVLLVTLTSGYPGFTFLICRNKGLTLGLREEMGEDLTSPDTDEALEHHPFPRELSPSVSSKTPTTLLCILESFMSWHSLSSFRKPSQTSMCALNLWGAWLDSKIPEDKVSTSDFLLSSREIATIHVRVSWPVLQSL